MRSLAETDPEAVLSAALPSDALARVPETSRKYFETREKVEGELEVIAECEEHNGRIEYFVKQGDSRLPLYFAGEPDSKLVSGKKVTVDAVKLEDLLVASADSLKSTDSALATTEASALTGTTGEKRVLVILVNFQDKQTQPFTVEQARDVAFNTTSNYYREASYGQTSLVGDVFGWYTIPISSTVCDQTGIATYAKQAAVNAGANLASYNHFVYAFPVNACTFGGSGTLGGTNQVWLNGVFNLGTLGHELGHNLGLSHARSLDCGSTVIGDPCTTFEYGDAFDLMGTSNFAHFNVFQKERLGWVNSGGAPPIQTVTASGTYWLDAYAAQGTGVKGLKVLKSTDPVTGKRTWYYIERRAAIGFDGYLANNANVLNGVVVHTGNDSASQSYLLDMTPETNSWDDPALVAGRNFTDTAAGVTITTISGDSSGAWVQIDVAAQPCTRSNPSVAITPGQTPWLSPGATYSYTVTVTNSDGGGCSGDSFVLGANVPAGWNALFANPVLSVAPGGNASTTLSVSSSAGALSGTYSLSASAVNGSSSGYSGSASASYVVVSGLAVTASPGSAKYARTQKATVNATVSALGSPMAGASVTFTMTKPNGTSVSKSVVAGTTGGAVFTYTFDKRRDPLGTYNVTVSATGNGISGTGNTSFMVIK